MSVNASLYELLRPSACHANEFAVGPGEVLLIDETWKKPGTTAAERFDYLYSRPQLRAWVPKIEALSEMAGAVHALMNNCYRDYGVRNAADLISLLDG